MKINSYLVNRLIEDGIDVEKFCNTLDKLEFKIDDGVISNLENLVASNKDDWEKVLSNRITHLNKCVEFVILNEDLYKKEN